MFDNDFAALLPGFAAETLNSGGLLRAESESGLCRVMCFSPRHDVTLAEMDPEAIALVVEKWTEQTRELGAMENINYVQIFENKGVAMGCSNPHPHGQIWAQATLPNEPAKELRQMQCYHKERGRTLLSDYLDLELAAKERVVCENDAFVAIVPFWAVWPFETMVLCRRSVGSLLQLNKDEKMQLADIVKGLTARYDNLFNTAFPYSCGLHQAPTDGGAHPEWDLHLHFYPPLLRSASVKKFMVGYEMLGEPQRDLTPETSAARLRELAPRHYTEERQR